MGLEAPGPLLAEFSWAGFPSEVPRFFVRCLKDKVIPPDLADTMIANMGGATVGDLEAGHRAFDTHPGQLASQLQAPSTQLVPTPHVPVWHAPPQPSP